MIVLLLYPDFGLIDIGVEVDLEARGSSDSVDLYELPLYIDPSLAHSSSHRFEMGQRQE